MHIFNIQFIWYLKGPADLLKYLTNWMLIFNTLFLFASLMCDKLGNKASQTLLAVHHILFQLVVPGHILVVSVYWSILHEKELQKREGLEGKELEIINLYIAHILPIVGCFGNFLITDVCMKSSHSKVLIPIAVAYAVVNYLETKSRGEPLYFFLTWEDETTIYIYTVITLITIAAFHVLAYITYSIKRSKSNSTKFD